MKDNNKKFLIGLTETVAVFLTNLDIEMKKPSTVERGRKIAKFCNYLESVNDASMHFGLKYGWKKIARIKKKRYFDENTP